MPDNGDYIADYLSGSLSPEEMKIFEERLKTDEDLNREYQLLSYGMESLEARLMLEEVENDPEFAALDKEYDAYFRKQAEAEKKKRFRTVAWRTLQAAAFIGALLVIRAVLFAVTAVKLYDKYYDPLAREEIQIISDSTSASLQAGIDLYLLEDYVGAVKELVAIPEGRLYLGLSQLELKEYDSALASFQAYKEANPDSPDVNWYLGLTYLRLDDLDDAVESLQKLTSTENPYRLRAEKLTGKIEKVKAAR